MRPAEDVGSVGTNAYQLLGQINTFRVNQNNTTTPLVHLTARSLTYDVVFSWDVTRERYIADGANNLASEKTGEVDEICSLAHVQAVRSEQELSRSDLLYNYLVVTVGTDDLTVTDEVSIRMDQLQTPGAFKLINDAWDRITKAVLATSTP